MASIAITVVESTYAYNAIPPLGIPGQPTTNYTLIAADYNAIAEIVREYVRDQFLAIDSNADANTTVSVAIS